MIVFNCLRLALFWLRVVIYGPSHQLKMVKLKNCFQHSATHILIVFNFSRLALFWLQVVIYDPPHQLKVSKLAKLCLGSLVVGVYYSIHQNILLYN